MGILKREGLIDEIINFNSRDTVKLLTGVRMAGKTTLIRSVIEELKNRGVNDENIFYISFRSLDYYSASSHEIYSEIKSKLADTEGKIYLFFDHVEEFNDWQFVVNAFRTWNNCDVTAAINYSQFYTLGKNHLAGRSFSFEVYPFSFKEFLQYKKEFTDDEKSDKEFFIEYIKYGGMPEVVQKEGYEKYRLLKTICEVIRYCDFIGELDAESYLVNDFLRYMILTFTEKFSKKQINNYLFDMFDNETLSPLLHNLKTSSFMPASDIIYHGNRLKFDEKYYLIDHGFYALLNRFYNVSPENIIKNVVYVELLRRGYRVFFTENREKYVDFICSGNNRLIAIQFDYIFASEKIIEKEIDFLNSNAKDHEKYIITTGDYDLSEHGVKHLNVIDFLLGDEI